MKFIMIDKNSKNASNSHYNDKDDNVNSQAYFSVKNALNESDLMKNEESEGENVYMNLENSPIHEEQEKTIENNEKKEKGIENLKKDGNKDEGEENKEVPKERNIRDNEKEEELLEIREEFLPQEEEEEEEKLPEKNNKYNYPTFSYNINSIGKFIFI